MTIHKAALRLNGFTGFFPLNKASIYMGCGTPAASEKFSRNEGLASVPAIFGPHNPAQPAASGDLPERQTTGRQGEILTFARFAAQDRGRQAARCPFGPVAARRMIAASDREDDPAQQPRLQAGPQPAEAGPVDDSAAILVEFERFHRRLSQAPLAGDSEATLIARHDA